MLSITHELVLSRLENPTETLVHKYRGRFFSPLSDATLWDSQSGSCQGSCFGERLESGLAQLFSHPLFLMSEGRHFCDKPSASPMSPEPGAHALVPGSDGAGEAPARRRQSGALRLRVPGSPRPRHQVGARSLITTPSAG